MLEGQDHDGGCVLEVRVTCRREQKAAATVMQGSREAAAI